MAHQEGGGKLFVRDTIANLDACLEIVGDVGMPPDIADSSGLPDIYADNTQVTITPFGVNITFGLSKAHPQGSGEESGDSAVPADPKVRLRMSLEHAKIVAMLLRKNLKVYEERLGVKISLPSALHEDLGLPEEDW